MAFGRHMPELFDVLIVDADPSQRRTLAGLISERALGRFQATACATSAEALAATRAGTGTIMIADIETIGGTARLTEIACPALPLIATSAVSSLNTAVAAVKAGAIDFLPKPIGAKALFERLEAAAASWRQSAPSSDAPPGKTNTPDYAGFIGRSPAMLAVYDQIGRMAPSRAPVFITGESGTGKELCAEAIHRAAGRAGRPFIAINCSAIPRDLMESEIFGHVRGAFTGAAENRPGAAEQARGGTLFLDEIGEMDLGLQTKLLRFVQTGSLQRVGGSELKRVDVRLVSATNREPFAEVEAGRLRDDLFYRLHVLPIHLPPLRARPEDIMALAEAFLLRYAAEEGRGFHGFDAEAAEVMRAGSWPGNVRQLQNVVRRIVVLHDGKAVTRAMLPAGLVGSAEDGSRPRIATASPANAPILPFWEEERRIIENAVAASGGNVPRAAAALDISPSTIYRKRQAWAARLQA